MLRELKTERPKELQELCGRVKQLCQIDGINESEELVRNAMMEFPHAAEPHNLMGILLERRGDHAAAMKHFRAAWALDPTYLPARMNLESQGTFVHKTGLLFDEADCPSAEEPVYEFVNDAKGIGHFMRRGGILK